MIRASTDKVRGHMLPAAPVVSSVALGALGAAVIGLSDARMGQITVVAISAFLFGLIALGIQRMALTCLLAAAVLLPANDLRVTPWLAVADVLLVAAAALALIGSPWALRRFSAPPMYVVGSLILILAGLVATALSDAPTESLRNLAVFAGVALALPLAFALWRPALSDIKRIATSYVFGQSVSIAVGMIEGANVYTNRVDGLTSHPNHLGLMSAISIGLLVFLFKACRRRWRPLTLALGAWCLVGVLTSGSRAALLAVMTMAIAVALITRAWKLAILLMASCLVIVVLAESLLQSLLTPGSASARLLGDSSATAANAARRSVVDANLDAFLLTPWTGRGFADALEAHSVFLEIGVAAGILGLVGYLCVIWCCVRPLWRGDVGVMRWLALPAWVYLIAGLFSNALWDRYIWLPLALGLLAYPARRAADSLARLGFQGFDQENPVDPPFRNTPSNCNNRPLRRSEKPGSSNHSSDPHSLIRSTSSGVKTWPS